MPPASHGRVVFSYGKYSFHTIIPCLARKVKTKMGESYKIICGFAMLVVGIEWKRTKNMRPHPSENFLRALAQIANV